MREPAKRLVVSGLDRLLSERGLEEDEVALARADMLRSARVRVGAALGRRGVISGLRVVVTRPGRAELRPVEIALPGAGQVTVEVSASAISPGTERAQWLRLPNAQPSLPFEPGYSGAGRVLAAGPEVDDLDTGMLVAVPRARHASVVTVPAAWATPVPDGVGIEHAALVYLAIIAGYGVRRAGHLRGEPVCVIGAGPIGALAHRLAMLSEPGPVTVVAKTRRREREAMRAGASRFITASEVTEDIGAAAVIEATGDPDALELALAAARAEGAVVLLGSPRGPVAARCLAQAQRKRLRLTGAHVSSLATEAKRDRTDPFEELSTLFLSALADGRIDTSDLVGEAVDPREIGLLYRRLARGEVTTAHLDWSLLPSAERVRRRRLMSPPTLPTIASPVRGPEPARAPDAGRRLRFSVVGCGDIGLFNARAIAGAANAELVLCHDVVSALAETAAERYGGTSVDSSQEAFDPERVDAVFLSLPHDLHAPVAAQAAAAGLHVVVEKPLAADLEGAHEAVEAADAAGVALSVCFSFRYEQVVQTARALVQAGALGSLRGLAVVFHTDKPPSYWLGGFSGRAASGWRSSRERAGGGVLIMNLTHYVDLFRYVAGAEPERVAALARTDEGAEVEDGIALAVGFAGGAIGSMSGSASTRGAPVNRFEIWGEAGTIRLTPQPSVYTERAIEGLPVGRWAPIANDLAYDLRRIYVERFSAAVLDGRRPEIDGADGLAVQAFIDASYRATDTGQPATVQTRERAPA